MKNISKILILAVSMISVNSFCSYCAGWQNINNQWAYVDDNNNREYNVWRKGSDDKPRWIGSDGFMLTNSWVDDEYFVDEYGVVVTKNWKQIDNVWYYFDYKGKVVKDKWQQSGNKWYYLNDEGKMATGWILDNQYYLGEDGAMKIGWQYLVSPDLDEPIYNNGPIFENEDNKKWYYFSSNGRKYSSNDGIIEKRIDGKRYCFNESGALQLGWVHIPNNRNDNVDISQYKYYNEDGSLRTGWYSLEPPKDLRDNYENDVEWFYFNSQGVPLAAKSDVLQTSDIVRINGKSYIFNEKGNPVYGLKKIYSKNNDNYQYYYLGNMNQCFIQRGKIKLSNSNGDMEEYYFTESSGIGFSGVKNGYLYYKGKLQKADPWLRYQVISLPNDNNTSYINYVVNSSGRVIKNTTVKDKDFLKYKTSASGVLIQVDDSKDVAKDLFMTALEPIIE